MKLAIADPPYPPMFSVRYDLAGGASRVTRRSRATRWYGEPRDGRRGDPAPADHHDDAARWDQLTEHRRLIEYLADTFDGWAIATTPDGLGAYHPLPVEARVMAWVRLNALPGGNRLRSTWEPVIVYTPPERRVRDEDRCLPYVADSLVAGVERQHFVGAKPEKWSRWVLDALGYLPDDDDLVDLFPGSGSVSRATDQGVLL